MSSTYIRSILSKMTDHYGAEWESLGITLYMQIDLRTNICQQILFFTEYGRTCNDIGCPSTEVCVMTADSCNYGQQDGKECGRYPTCKRSSSGAGQSPGKFHKLKLKKKKSPHI